MTRRSKKPKPKARPDGPKVESAPQSAPAAAVENESGAPSELAASASRISTRTILIAAAAVAVLWWIALGMLALFTANPVTLNREQILRSSYVVTGKVVDAERGTVEVEKEWKQSGFGGTVHVGRLEETGARAGRSYIIPIEKAADGMLNVTRSRLPNEAPLIYPATAEAAAQLSRLLQDGAMVL